MVEDYPAWRRAEGKMQIAIARLASKYLFHTKILERFRVKANARVNTMGVTPSGQDVLLLHNPGFVLRLPLDQLAGVLLHEVNHVLFRHIFTDPADYPDRWARIVAMEVTANEFVMEPLPEGGIRLEQFPELPPMESTDQRYRRLEKVRSRMRIGTLLGDLAIGIAGPGQEASAAQHGGTAEGDTGPCGLVVDDHEVWEQARQDSERSEESVEGLVQDAIIEVGPAQVPEGLRNALRNLMIGDLAGDGVCLLGPPGHGRLDWQRLLRRHVGQILEVRPVFTRPPRRFPNLVGILPGRQRRGNRPKIMAVVDTSGSITPALLELVNAELARLARCHAVTVVECDAQIHSVYRYRQIRSVTGRGGTDLRPPFAPEFLRQHRPNLIVYFTDGHGPVPDRPPRPPVVWCVTPQGKRPADWGRVVQMEAEEPGHHQLQRRRSVPGKP